MYCIFVQRVSGGLFNKLRGRTRSVFLDKKETLAGKIIVVQSLWFLCSRLLSGSV